MHDSPNPPRVQAKPAPGPVRRLIRWTVRRRRAMTAHALRGGCYGAGAGAVGLFFWWIEQGL